MHHLYSIFRHLQSVNRAASTTESAVEKDLLFSMLSTAWGYTQSSILMEKHWNLNILNIYIYSHLCQYSDGTCLMDTLLFWWMEPLEIWYYVSFTAYLINSNNFHSIKIQFVLSFSKETHKKVIVYKMNSYLRFFASILHLFHINVCYQTDLYGNLYASIVCYLLYCSQYSLSSIKFSFKGQ